MQRYGKRDENVLCRMAVIDKETTRSSRVHFTVQEKNETIAITSQPSITMLVILKLKQLALKLWVGEIQAGLHPTSDWAILKPSTNSQNKPTYKKVQLQRLNYFLVFFFPVYMATLSWCRGSSSVQILGVEVNSRPYGICRLVTWTGSLKSDALLWHIRTREGKSLRTISQSAIHWPPQGLKG